MISAARAIVQGLGDAISFTAGAVWLLFLYIFTAWIAIGSLSSIQLREDVVADHQKTIDAIYREILRKRQELENTNSLIVDKVEYKDSIDKILTILRGNSTEISRIHAELAMMSGQLGAGVEQIKNPEFYPDNCQIKESVKHERFIELCSTRNDYLLKIISYEDQKRIYSDEAAKVANELEVAKQQLADLKAAALGTGDEEDIFSRWQFMESWGYQAHLVMPNQVLTLLLTLAMGALGSVVQMTWSFVKHDQLQTFRRYLLLPFVGSLSAFIIFVFLKAGQITISSDGSEPLSPFFLSFVGIISGLLSDRAYAKIESVGRGFFGTTEDEQRRWGVGLEQAMATAGVGSTDLMVYLDLGQDDVERIVREGATATPEQQRFIAAVLKRKVRELFTDIPPGSGADRTSKAPPVEVPDLVGKDQTGAERALSAAGLKTGTTQTVASAEQPQGHVVAHTPPAGEHVARESEVDITLSSGPGV